MDQQYDPSYPSNANAVHPQETGVSVIPMDGMTAAQPGQNVVFIQTPVKPSSYLSLAIFTTICCNLIFGIPAIIFSVLSSSSADNNELEDARSKGKISMFLSITGIVVTILAIIGGISYTIYITTAVVGGITDGLGNIFDQNIFNSTLNSLNGTDQQQLSLNQLFS